MADASTAHRPFTDHPFTDGGGYALPVGARPPDQIPLDSSQPNSSSSPPRYWPHTLDAKRAAAARAQVAAGCFDGHVESCRSSCPDCMYRPCAHCAVCGACPCTWHPDCPRLPFAQPNPVTTGPAATAPDPVPDRPLCWSCGTATDSPDCGGLCPDCAAAEHAVVP